MQQFTSLGMAPENLPEEALTQIYQASIGSHNHCMSLQLCWAIIDHPAQLYSCVVIDPTPHTIDVV